MEDLHRNMIVSLVCGFAFALSWWLMIDILSLYPEVGSYRHGLLNLPIFLSTASLFANGAIPNSSLTDTFAFSRTIFFHRCAFFLSMALGFSGVLSAIIICATKGTAALPVYALVGIPLSNVLILVSNIVFKFAVVDDSEIFI